jgi:PilZ domain
MDFEREPASSLLDRGARLPLREPILVCCHDNGMEMVYRAQTVSISRRGCAISSRRFFRSGSHVRLEYKGKTMEGSVVYSLKNSADKLFQTGIGFADDAQAFWQVDDAEMLAHK